MCGPRRRFAIAYMLCVLVLIMIVWILTTSCSPSWVGVIVTHKTCVYTPCILHAEYTPCMRGGMCKLFLVCVDQADVNRLPRKKGNKQDDRHNLSCTHCSQQNFSLSLSAVSGRKANLPSHTFTICPSRKHAERNKKKAHHLYARLLMLYGKCPSRSLSSCSWVLRGSRLRHLIECGWIRSVDVWPHTCGQIILGDIQLYTVGTL
jgi:hypothetical protein